MKKIFVSVFLIFFLNACGFHLRGQADLPFTTLYILPAEGSAFTTELRRVIESGTQTRLVNRPEDAQATLHIVNESREKSILSLSSAGRVREFQLRYRISFRLFDKDRRDWIPASEILLKRDFTFNDTQLLAKETEEAMLFRDMQSDAVQQLVRRLRAVKVPS